MDLHVHSTCSADGLSPVVEYALRAAEAGLAEVGFCEHQDFDRRDQGYLFWDPEQVERELAAARDAVPGVPLRRGIEVTYQSTLESQIRTWLAHRPWDYVVASVHLVDYVDGWAIVSEPGAMAAYFYAHSQRDAYLPYFEELLHAARSGLGDVLGHFDLVKRYGTTHYGPFEPVDFEDEIRAVLRAAISTGVGLEVNTSGLRQAPAEPYPGLAVLRWYRELGGEVLTVGSDAHHVRDLGSGVARALDLARAAGFRAIATFEGRQVHWIDLA